MGKIPLTLLIAKELSTAYDVVLRLKQKSPSTQPKKIAWGYIKNFHPEKKSSCRTCTWVRTPNELVKVQHVAFENGIRKRWFTESIFINSIRNYRMDILHDIIWEKGFVINCGLICFIVNCKISWSCKNTADTPDGIFHISKFLLAPFNFLVSFRSFQNETSKNESCLFQNKDALAGNRTRAPRVAGEDSTTEPPMRKVFLHRESNPGRLGESQES